MYHRRQKNIGWTPMQGQPPNRCLAAVLYWCNGTLVQHITGSAYRACDTSRGRGTSVRHITGSAYEKRAVDNNGASVTFQCGMWSETAT